MESDTKPEFFDKSTKLELPYIMAMPKRLLKKEYQ